MREGGTIGAVLSMEQILKCPIVFMGLSLPHHGYHAPNENYDWGQAGGGIRRLREVLRGGLEALEGRRDHDLRAVDPRRELEQRAARGAVHDLAVDPEARAVARAVERRARRARELDRCSPRACTRARPRSPPSGRRGSPRSASAGRPPGWRRPRTVSPTPMSGTRISPLIVGRRGRRGGRGRGEPPPQPVSVEATVAPVVTTKTRRRSLQGAVPKR